MKFMDLWVRDRQAELKIMRGVWGSQAMQMLGKWHRKSLHLTCAICSVGRKMDSIDTLRIGRNEQSLKTSVQHPLLG